MKKPIGVLVIGWTEIIMTLMLWGWIFLRVGLNPYKTSQLLVQVTYSIFGLLGGVGILMLKNWARLLAILLNTLKSIGVIIVTFYSIYIGNIRVLEIMPNTLLLVICATIVLYLKRPSIKSFFLKTRQIKNRGRF